MAEPLLEKKICSFILISILLHVDQNNFIMFHLSDFCSFAIWEQKYILGPQFSL